jgi:molybdopterin-guanine dinucleotide biosynthesis protein A
MMTDNIEKWDANIRVSTRDVTMKLPVLGCILAGGTSKRMGRDKAFLPWAGRSLLAHQLQRMSEVAEEVAVVVRHGGERFSTFGCRVIEDGAPEPGAPLYGLAAALEESAGATFVLAVDLPRVPVTLIRALSERLLDSGVEAVVPESAEGLLEPLCAAYRSAVAAGARQAIAAGDLSLHELARSIRSEVWPEDRWRPFCADEDPFCNINRPGEYLKALGRTPVR